MAYHSVMRCAVNSGAKMKNEIKNPTENPFPDTTQADIDSQQIRDDNDRPLKELLPDLDDIPHDELIDYFKRLALRCFNSENKLDLAMEIYKTDQGTIREMRSVNSKLMLEVERLGSVVRSKNDEILRLIAGRKEV